MGRDTSVLVVFPVLCEAYTLVLRRLGGRYAAGWLKEVLSVSLPVNPDAKDYLDAAQALGKYADQPITLVDAVVAGLTRRLAVPVWTFDRHFVTMRASVWRSDVG